MAVTVSRYNHTPKKFLNSEVDLAALKFILLTDDAAFDATDTATTDVTNAGAYEVSGNGWSAGGELLDNAAITTVATNGAMLDADDIVVTASGGPIGPAPKGAIVDSTNDEPHWFVDFGEDKQADDGADFKIVINASGIFRVT